jgi:hypothetical protein
MKLSFSRTKFISFSWKTNVQIHDYKLCQSSITQSESIKDLGIFVDTKLHFHNVSHTFSHCVKLLRLVRNIT